MKPGKWEPLGNHGEDGADSNVALNKSLMDASDRKAEEKMLVTYTRTELGSRLDRVNRLEASIRCCSIVRPHPLHVESGTSSPFLKANDKPTNS